jgi:hypothetical protein
VLIIIDFVIAAFLKKLITREQMPSKKLLIGNDRLDIKMLANDKLEASNLLLYHKV